MRSAPARALAPAILTMVLLAACQSTTTTTGGVSSPQVAAEIVTVDGGSYLRVQPAELAAMLRAKDFSLVNVHVPYAGEIDPTDAFIPFDTIAARLADLPAKDQPIVLYCQTGRMSAIAAETLVRAGYTDVWDLGGGMEAWTAAGLPLVQRAPG